MAPRDGRPLARVVEALRAVVTGHDEGGEPVLREVLRRSLAIVSTQGPALRAPSA